MRYLSLIAPSDISPHVPDGTLGPAVGRRGTRISSGIPGQLPVDGFRSKKRAPQALGHKPDGQCQIA